MDFWLYEYIESLLEKGDYDLKFNKRLYLH